MKTSRILLQWTAFCVPLLLAAGCGKSPSGNSPDAKEASVTGKPSDPPVELKAQWNPGHRYVMHMEMNQSTTLPWGQPPTTQETTMSQDYAVSVTNAAGGNRGLELEIQALALDVTFGDRTLIRFDSLNKVTPNEGPGVEALEKVIGGRIRYLVSPDNQITQVEGINELVTRIENAANAGGGGGGRGGGRGFGMMGGALRGIFNPDYFKQIVDLSGLPQNAVRIGEQWPIRKEISAGMVGTLVLNTTNTLKGWQQHEGRKCARIEFTGTLATKAGAVQGMPFGGATKLEDGTITGTSWFAPELGLPVESAISQSYNLTGTRPNWGGMRRGTNAPAPATNAPPEKFSTPMHQTISVKLTDVQPLDQTAPAKGTPSPGKN